MSEGSSKIDCTANQGVYGISLSTDGDRCTVDNFRGGFLLKVNVKL